MPAPAAAWGWEAHFLIMERALALLPPELRPLFEKHRAKVIERIIDPDTWRNAGFPDEEPNHFLDLDWEGYGKDPFPELPRDYTAAVAKFGRARIADNGRVPWRTEEMFGDLQRAFQDYGRRGAFGQNDIIHYAAWLSHYVSDAIQPFHGVINYDGQLTKQNGIHARFESTLVERYQSQLVLTPRPLAPDPRAARLHLRAADRGHAARAGPPQGRPRGARLRARPTTTSTSTRSSAPPVRCSSAASTSRLPPWRR